MVGTPSPFVLTPLFPTAIMMADFLYLTVRAKIPRVPLFILLTLAL